MTLSLSPFAAIFGPRLASQKPPESCGLFLFLFLFSNYYFFHLDPLIISGVFAFNSKLACLVLTKLKLLPLPLKYFYY